jgi:predicted Zn-dependent peptidase
MSSRLFQEIREARGLAYSIYSFHWSYADTGLFGFYAGAKPGDVRETIFAALDCLGEAAERLGDAEARRAKAQTKVSLLTALESSAARIDQIARQLAIFGRVLPRDEIIAKIDALTTDDIMRAGRRLLRSAPTVAAIGSLRQVPGSAEIVRRLGRS